MALHEYLRDQSHEAAQAMKLLGGGMGLIGALSGNDSLMRFGAGTFLTGMIVDGDGFMPPPIRRLHDWRDHNRHLFNDRVDMWDRLGKWHHHPIEHHHLPPHLPPHAPHLPHHAPHLPPHAPRPAPRPSMATPGFNDRHGR